MKMISFYSVKLRKNMDVNEVECSKLKKEITIKGGKGKAMRYMVMATVDGVKLCKFVKSTDFDSFACKEV
jgi:hypothetical protein